MTRSICTALCWFLVGLITQPAWGGALNGGLSDSEAEIRTWLPADGLPADSVTAIIQTRDGYLWIGTSAGLARFDGVSFAPIPLPSATSNSPVRVTALCEDNSGRVWVGTQQDGLYAWDCSGTRHFTHINGLLDDTVTSLATDNSGSVWIGTKSGLNLFAGQNFRALTRREGLPDNMVSGVHVARSGTVWITTRNGMSRFLNGRLAQYDFQTESQGRSPEYLGAYEDRRGNLWAYGDTYLINLANEKRFNYFRGTETASVRIWSLCEGHDGRLWIATSGRRLFCIEDNHIQPVIFSELPWTYDVRAIAEDRDGNLWLGSSGGGLVQLRPQSVHVQRVGHGLPASPPSALALDAAGRIYVGLQHNGIFVGEAGRFERLAGSGLEVQDFVTSLAIGQDGTLWAGTLGNGLYGLLQTRGVQLSTSDGLADDTILSVAAATNGIVWAGTKAGTLHEISGLKLRRFDAADGLGGAAITALLPAGNGIWVGTRDGALLQETKGKFEQRLPPEALGRHSIVTLHETGGGRLWIGTAGGGLACRVGDTLRTWTRGDGLPDEWIAGIAEDPARNLWLVTGAGVYRMAAAVVLDAVEGRGALVCKLISEARTSLESAHWSGGTRAVCAGDGRLWFATSDGVLNVDPRRRESEPKTLPVYLESFALNDQSPQPATDCTPRHSTHTGPYRMPAELRSLKFQFTALNFTTPGKVRFRHRLEGFEPDWVGEAAERTVNYGRLPFGNYRFHLAARTGDGPWFELATPFAFVVPTPLYFQPWAVALYILTVIGLVTAIVRVVSHRRLRTALARLEQQQALERERMRIARDMHDEIGSKLTKISFLSEHARVDAAGSGSLARKIESIAASSRELLQTMDEIVWVVNPHNDTLEHLADYLSHYATEYFQNTSVQCDLRLPRAIPRHPLSSEARHHLFLAFEESLNNILKHAGASVVNIEMTVKGLEFEIQVADNGHGFELSPGATPNRGSGGRGGNGLKNMRQRMADIGGTCEIRSQPGGGTLVALRLQLNPKTAPFAASES